MYDVAAHAQCAMRRGREKAREKAVRWPLQDTHSDGEGGEQRLQRGSSSIIKAKTRTRDKGRGMRWKRGGGGGVGGTNRIKTTAVERGANAGENKRGME